MAYWVGAKGQVNSATKVKTCPHLDVTQRKLHAQNENFFFISTRRLAESVEGLISSLAQSAGE